MNIVKQTTGNVVLTDTAGNILKVFVNVNALDIVNSNELIIKYGYNQWTSLFANQIDNTQVEPAAAITFNGNAYDLATLLSANFFFEVSGGGTAASISYDNTISGLTATDVQDAIDELANDIVSISFPIEIQAACSDETTALTAGTNKVTFRLPAAFTLTGVRASLTTAQTSGSIFTVDINLGGTSVLSTKLTIDNTEKTSLTATTPAVISNTTMTDDGEITVDIDQIGDGTAKGLKITLIGFR
jgi:hypothetical protein